MNNETSRIITKLAEAQNISS